MNPTNVHTLADDVLSEYFSLNRLKPMPTLDTAKNGIITFIHTIIIQETSHIHAKIMAMTPTTDA